MDEDLERLLAEYAASGVLLDKISKLAQDALNSTEDYNKTLEQLFDTVAELMALEGYAEDEDEQYFPEPTEVKTKSHLTVVK